MKFPPVKWEKDQLFLLDQRLLPHKIYYKRCRNHLQVADAIKKMVVRGAPLLGTTVAYTFALALREKKFKSTNGILKKIKVVKGRLEDSRPTAKNLFYAIERMYNYVSKLAHGNHSIDSIVKLVLKEAKKIEQETEAQDMAIAAYGEKILSPGSVIMTICNAGGFATGGIGTALGIIKQAHKKKGVKKVFVNETRPYLQGARLTMLELISWGIDCELITDNMAGYFMSKEKIDAVIVGADRIALNGDVANKIGTYSLAILAKHHNIPFYVAAPISTIDPGIRSGNDIPIEERSPEEVRKFGGRYITLRDAKCRHPSFDVTPAKFISGIITDRGIVFKPYMRSIPKILGQ